MNCTSPCDAITSRAMQPHACSLLTLSPPLHLYVLHTPSGPLPLSSTPFPIPHPVILTYLHVPSQLPAPSTTHSHPHRPCSISPLPPPPSASHRRQCPVTLVLLSNREMIVGGKCGKLQCPMTMEFQWLLCMSLLVVFHEMAGTTRCT